jgi:hypothetical protein
VIAAVLKECFLIWGSPAEAFMRGSLFGALQERDPRCRKFAVRTSQHALKC